MKENAFTKEINTKLENKWNCFCETSDEGIIGCMSNTPENIWFVSTTIPSIECIDK